MKLEIDDVMLDIIPEVILCSCSGVRVKFSEYELYNAGIGAAQETSLKKLSETEAYFCYRSRLKRIALPKIQEKLMEMNAHDRMAFYAQLKRNRVLRA